MGPRGGEKVVKVHSGSELGFRLGAARGFFWRRPPRSPHPGPICRIRPPRPPTPTPGAGPICRNSPRRAPTPLRAPGTDGLYTSARPLRGGPPDSTDCLLNCRGVRENLTCHETHQNRTLSAINRICGTDFVRGFRKSRSRGPNPSFLSLFAKNAQNATFRPNANPPEFVCPQTLVGEHAVQVMGGAGPCQTGKGLAPPRFYKSKGNL